MSGSCRSYAIQFDNTEEKDMFIHMPPLWETPASILFSPNEQVDTSISSINPSPGASEQVPTKTSRKNLKFGNRLQLKRLRVDACAIYDTCKKDFDLRVQMKLSI